MSLPDSSQPILLETVKIDNGTIHNLPYHQQRCDQTRNILFNCTDTLTLADAILPPQKGLYRCRILYSKTFHSIEYLPYTPKEIHTLQIVASNIQYDFKFANREAFTKLRVKHADDILIEKEGYLTDTSIANIAFYVKGQWYTPSKPLLKGTMRQKLLDSGFLQTRNIKKNDLKHYTQVALMNAMIGFKVLDNIEILT